LDGAEDRAGDGGGVPGGGRRRGALNTTALWAARRYLDMSLLQPKEGVVTRAA
jgi:hypothetical protein